RLDREQNDQQDRCGDERRSEKVRQPRDVLRQRRFGYRRKRELLQLGRGRGIERRGCGGLSGRRCRGQDDRGVGHRGGLYHVVRAAVTARTRAATPSGERPNCARCFSCLLCCTKTLETPIRSTLTFRPWSLRNSTTAEPKPPSSECSS